MQKRKLINYLSLYFCGAHVFPRLVYQFSFGTHIMENSAVHLPPEKRHALVTGGNKGIGFQICRQLASKEGMVVILTSRDENRGIEAQKRLIDEEFDNVFFHQLDVVDSASVDALVRFVTTKFGKLDILVNNAGILGIHVDGDVSLFQEYVEAECGSLLAGELDATQSFQPKAKGRIIQTFEGAKECIETNYYGVKRVTQALIPLLQLSHSPNIVTVSSTFGSLSFLPNEWANGVLSSDDGDGVDQVVQQFLNDFQEGSSGHNHNHWPLNFAAYKVSKAAVNAYTRIVAKQYPDFCINAVCPGYARTDITYNSGPLSEDEAAEAAVKLALLPHGGPSGSFFLRMEALAL